MRLTDLPIAKNNAVYSSQLTQLMPTGQKIETHSSGTTDLAVFGGTLISSDKDYTKQDALLKQWNKLGSFNINDKNVQLQKPFPSADELKELEQKLQANGLGSEIDWNDFTNDLRGIGFDKNDSPSSLKADDINRKVDYLASRYAVMKDKIQSNYSGDEAKQHLDKLDEIFNASVEELASGYAGIVGDFLEQNGLAGEKDKIHQSVVAAVTNKAQAYSDYLADNPDFAGLNGTKDEWLLQDDEYIAAQLRDKNVQPQAAHAPASAAPAAPTAPASPVASTADVAGAAALQDPTKADKGAASELYSQEELDILGRYASELSHWEDTAKSMDEERIGLDFALMSMKTDLLKKEHPMSAGLSSTLDKMMQGFMSNSLDRLDAHLAAERERGPAKDDEAGFAKLDHNAVWDVYNKAMEHYKLTDNMMDAFIQGSKYAAEQSTSKTDDGTYRHKNAASYWDQFSSKPYSSSNPYDNSMSSYEKYATSIDDFKASLSDGTGIRLNFRLTASINYGYAGNHPTFITFNAKV